jgi:hypothetical protein
MLPQFYHKIAALNVKHHSNLYIEPVSQLAFAKSANAVHLQVSEFGKALSAYPIVFTGEKEHLFAAALTGLDKDQNLFVDEDGQWQQGYVPAYVRRYPFVIANKEKDLATVCIDESYDGFNTDALGESLFTSKGEHSAYLKQTITFLEDFEKASVKTQYFCQQLLEYDLLEPMSAQILPTNKQQKQVSVKGFSVVSRDKLAKLSAEQLKTLHDNGVLESIYRHLSSLEQFSGLLARYNRLKS